MHQDSIVAVSTPRGAAARGVIRVSGAQARSLTARLFHPAPGQPRLADAGRQTIKGTLVLGRSLVEAPCTLWIFPAPRSYTGEDVVELHLPGSPNLLEIVQELFTRAGARPAGPGEFTRRAFENGRMDLTRAEAVATIIGARDEEERLQALALLEGGLERRVAILRDRILEVLVPLEVNLDFSDQDVEGVVPTDVAGMLRNLEGELDRLASSTIERAPRSSYRTVLSGAPNVGKSSLFNRLLGRDEALVSTLPGTTRDVLTGEIHVGPFKLQLVDTAGSQSSECAAGAAAQALRRRMLREADLVLEVRDGREPGTSPAPADPVRMTVWTHGDLLGVSEKASLQGTIVSNVTGAGVADLLRSLEELIRATVAGMRGAPVPINQRQAASFRVARDRVGGALRAHTEESGAELVASDLHAALDALRRITGDQDTQVLDRIFAEFCIGK